MCLQILCDIAEYKQVQHFYDKGMPPLAMHFISKYRGNSKKCYELYLRYLQLGNPKKKSRPLTITNRTIEGLPVEKTISWETMGYVKVNKKSSQEVYTTYFGAKLFPSAKVVLLAGGISLAYKYDKTLLVPRKFLLTENWQNEVWVTTGPKYLTVEYIPTARGLDYRKWGAILRKTKGGEYTATLNFALLSKRQQQEIEEQVKESITCRKKVIFPMEQLLGRK